VPTLGGRIMLPTTANAAGAVDQRVAEARDDVHGPEHPSRLILPVIRR
jgi:hypothetical protein